MTPIGRVHTASQNEWESTPHKVAEKLKITEAQAKALRDNLGWDFKHFIIPDSGELVFVSENHDKQLKMFRDHVCKYTRTSEVIFIQSTQMFAFVVF